MLQTLVVSLFAAGAISTVVLAAPADEAACNGLAFELAEKAAKTDLPEAKADEVDKMIVKLEGQCADGQFAEAGATANEVEAALK